MTRIEVACTDLEAAIDYYVALGFRHDMIMPADAPRLAQFSGYGLTLHVTADAARPQPGRAGMIYRDLVPNRLDGRLIASHITIPVGGPVADYVHYHNVRFQMIYCKKGWVRVVYEDQGPPFVMQEGDCVLQPPLIRHRVLESSSGLEVIEIASPAEHETWRDHDLALPTPTLVPQRDFAGQRFVRHVAAGAAWHDNVRDLGIARATNGLASARVLRLSAGIAGAQRTHDGEFVFVAILAGRALLRSRTLGIHTLGTDDACVLPAGADYALDALAPSDVLEVTLRRA